MLKRFKYTKRKGFRYLGFVKK